MMHICPWYAHVLPRMCARYAVDVVTVCLWYVMLLYAQVMHCWSAHGMHMLCRGCVHDMQLSDVGTVCLWCAHHITYTVDNTVACPWYAHVTLKMCAPYAYHMHVICLCETLLICACYAHVIPRMCAWYAVDLGTVCLWYSYDMRMWCTVDIPMVWSCAHDIKLMRTVCLWYSYDIRMWCTVDISMVCTCCTEDVRMICSWCGHRMLMIRNAIICACDALLICPWYAHDILIMCAWYTIDAHRMLITLMWYANVMHCWYSHQMHMLYLGCEHDMQLMRAP